MEDERDIVVFTNEEGDEIGLEVIDYFTHEDQEYAVLIDPDAAGDKMEDDSTGCGCDCECSEQELYIMKVQVNDDMEEFLPVDEDKFEELTEIVKQRLCEECDEE